MRSVSVLEVADPAGWGELAAEIPLDSWAPEVLDARRRVVAAGAEGPLLQRLGARALVRYARRGAAEIAAAREDLSRRIAGLPYDIRRVLHAAQRHALDGVVAGLHAWDPLHDAPAVRALHGADLMHAVPPPADTAPREAYTGFYRLHPDLPPPPDVPYDLAEAAMEETPDLSAPGTGPVALLHDMAALAAALGHVEPHRTHAGTLAKADARRLGQWLGVPTLAASGKIEEDPRWAKALRALEALGAAWLDPLTRRLHLDLGLDAALAGPTHEAVDRLVHRLVDRDLHVLIPAVRAALRAAGEGAVDELIFVELLMEQHRGVLFPPWNRGGTLVYPLHEGEEPRLYDDAGFEAVERPLIGQALRQLERLGMIRRAPGIFAGTEDGRRWARAVQPPLPPVWVSSDLELIVPPDAVTPWERFQLERLGRCLSRDVVDRYALERKGLAAWLAWHDVEEALELLRRRCPGVPAGVEDTLRSWARAATQIVVTRGVLIE